MKLRNFVIFSLILSTMYGCAYSNGNRVGTVVKFSKKGWVCSTYEGEFVLGGAASAMMLNKTWLFSVKDSQVADQIDALQGKGVKLHYEQLKMRLPCQGDTEYFVTKVEAIK